MTTEQEVENVFKDLPAHGTVLATVTEEELDSFIYISSEYEAVQSSTVSYRQTKEANDSYRIYWIQLCQKYDIPYAWPIRIDTTTGKIFVDNK